MVAPLNRRGFLGWLSKVAAASVTLAAAGCATSIKTTVNVNSPPQGIQVTIRDDVRLAVLFIPDGTTIDPAELPRVRKEQRVAGGLYVIGLPEE